MLLTGHHSIPSVPEATDIGDGRELEPWLHGRRLSDVKRAHVRQAGSGILAAAAGAAILALAACTNVVPTSVPRTDGTALGSTQRSTGVITGTLGIYGGVLETHRYPVPQAGTVRLIGAHGHIDVTVGRSGQFAVRVPAGRYEVIAGLRRPMDWPMGSCVGLYGRDARLDRQKGLGYIVVKKDEHLRVRVGCLAA